MSKLSAKRETKVEEKDCAKISRIEQSCSNTIDAFDQLNASVELLLLNLGPLLYNESNCSLGVSNDVDGDTPKLCLSMLALRERMDALRGVVDDTIARL